MVGSGVSYELFDDQGSDCLFCFRVPKGFVLSAESAYHGRVTMERTSNLDAFMPHQPRAR